MKNEDIIIGETYRIFFERKIESCRNCSKIIGFLCENCSKKSFNGPALCIAKQCNKLAFLISDTEMAVVSIYNVLEISEKKIKIRKAFIKNFLNRLKKDNI